MNEMEKNNHKETPPLTDGQYYKCIKCKTCNIRRIEGEPERKCENCKNIPEITKVESEWMELMYAEIQGHTNRYNAKKTNPPRNWNRREDPDFRGRMDKINILSKFARPKNIWIWDRIHMY